MVTKITTIQKPNNTHWVKLYYLGQKTIEFIVAKLIQKTLRGGGR